MQNFQTEKRLVLNYYEAISSSSEYEIEQICSRYMSDNCIWQSYHPFKDQRGGSDIARHFWLPFKSSLYPFPLVDGTGRELGKRKAAPKRIKVPENAIK